MASATQTARMRAVADDRLRNQVAALAERAGVAMPGPVTGIRDAEIRAIREREQIANVIADVLGTDLPFAELRFEADDTEDDAIVQVEGGEFFGMIEMEMPGIAEILAGVAPTYNAGEGRIPLSDEDVAALATLVEEAFSAAFDAAEARGIAAAQEAAGDGELEAGGGADTPNGETNSENGPVSIADVPGDEPNRDEGPATSDVGSSAATAPETTEKPKRGKAKAKPDESAG